MTVTVTVRAAKDGDEADILRLVKALADYENEPDAVKATAESLRAILFGDNPRAFAHVAEQGGRIVGMAVWFFNFSTWTGRHGIFLEDLFIDPAARKAGVANLLFRALAIEARANDCARIDWQVLDWNDLAKGFYRKLGAHHKAAWEPWRLDGAALDALAG